MRIACYVIMNVFISLGIVGVVGVVIVGVVVIRIVVSSGGIIAGRGRWVLRAGFLPTSCTRSDDEKKKDQFGRIQKGTEEDRSSVLHCISPIVCHLLFSSLSHFGLGRFAE